MWQYERMSRMNSGVSFNLKKKQVIIKMQEDAEIKEIITVLKRRVPELKKIYVDNEPRISIIGRNFRNKEMYVIQKIFDKYFNIEIEFDSPKMIGLYSIRKPFKKEIATSETKFYKSSLRSGQKVEFEGSIVVLGDVNVGAEVIAGENIVVVGCLRGMAHAGAKGNKEAIISATSIEATQIRISNVIKQCERDEFIRGQY